MRLKEILGSPPTERGRRGVRRAVLGEVNPVGRERSPQLPARLFLQAPRAAAGERNGPEEKGGTGRHGRRGALPRSSNSLGQGTTAATARGCPSSASSRC